MTSSKAASAVKAVKKVKKIKPMNEKEALEFIELLEEAHPNAQTELIYDSPYTLLVAVTLSAQATDVSVNKATKELFKVAATPEAMVALGEEKLASYISSIGLWRAKSRNVIALSQQLLEKHAGQVPDTREALEALPGVGRKTANVVLSIAFHQPTMAVDTHIFRIGNRTGLAMGKTPLDVEKKLLKRIPTAKMRDAHHWLILHGRYCCKAKKPECWRCPVAQLCHFPEKNLTAA